ncbi:MAG: FISUMP domain-containing protein [Bacteroidota bacterium]
MERPERLVPLAPRDGFTYGTLQDDRPDQRGLTFSYRTLKLKDNREWMAENFTFYIAENKSITWNTEYGAPNATRNKGFGLFYTWEAIHEVLPTGWRLPTLDEWNNLFQSYGGPSSAFDALVRGGTSGMDLQLLSWRAGRQYLKSEQLGNEGCFWSDSEGRDNRAAAKILLDRPGNTIKIEYVMKDIFLNVRLIKA